MADEPSVECPQCEHINEPAAMRCVNCNLDLDWARENWDKCVSGPAESHPPLILVVNDEIGGLTLVGIMLNRLGYRAAKAHDAYEALELTEHFVPDLIITDDMMPGIRGLEMIPQIKASPRLNSVPVIMLSARADYDTVRAVMDVGVVLFLSLPILHHDLCAVVASVLSGEPLPLTLIQHYRDVRERYIVRDKTYDKMYEDVSRKGFRVDHLYQGADLARWARLLQPAVIVVAFHLREADGLDVLSQLKADPELSGIPVVMWADEPEPELEQQAMQCGAQAVYTGPPDGGALAEVLLSVLAQVEGGQ